MTHFGKNGDKKNGFEDNSGWMAYPSLDGYVWLTTEENSLYKIDIYNNKIPFVQLSEGMRSFYEETQILNWIGTENGLIRRELDNNVDFNFVFDKRDNKSLSHNYVRKLYKDVDGDFWVGTISGLNKYNVRDRNFTRYMHDPKNDKSISEDNISVIL